MVYSDSLKKKVAIEAIFSQILASSPSRLASVPCGEKASGYATSLLYF